MLGEQGKLHRAAEGHGEPPCSGFDAVALADVLLEPATRMPDGTGRPIDGRLQTRVAYRTERALDLGEERFPDPVLP